MNSNSELKQAVQQLKQSGVRMTPQRYAILSHLIDSMTHPTADDIYKALVGQFPTMSVATVYNNLKVFLDTGLVRELSYGDHSSRYDADMSKHYHALCEQCGKIVDFHHPPLIEVEQTAENDAGFTVHGHRLEVYGICQECASKKNV